MLSVVNCDLVGEDNLVLGELLVEGVLGQGHHLFVRVVDLSLTQLIHDALAYCGLAGSCPSCHSDHEGSLKTELHASHTQFLGINSYITKFFNSVAWPAPRF